MKRFKYRPLTALLTFGAISGIGTSVGGGSEAYAADTPDVGVSQQAIDLKDLTKQCGFVCPGDTDADGIKVKTLAEGNASISGVPAVDGFFNSVLDFQVAAKSVAAGIDAEIEGIRSDFDLGPGDDVGGLLMAKLQANIEGDVSLKVEPPKCKADFKAELQAAARCDAEVTPGMVSVECKGGCDVEASADVMCSADAELRCTVQAPEVKCEGECTGTCNVELSAAAACDGTCHGECSGDCSAYVKNDEGAAQCAGKCSGMCKGSCDIDVAADASCEGTCRGECTMTKAPDAGCEGGIRAQCKAKAGASIKCDTKCDGDFEPPMVKAECQAKVQADAKLNVQCTPPRVALNYRLKANLDADARFQFESALKSLVKVRLPALKAAVARSEMVADAGADLTAAASGAVKGAVEAARAKGEIDVKFLFGLGCAVDQLKMVPGIIDGAASQLSASVEAAANVEGALKI